MSQSYNPISSPLNIQRWPGSSHMEPSILNTSTQQTDPWRINFILIKLPTIFLIIYSDLLLVGKCCSEGGNLKTKIVQLKDKYLLKTCNSYYFTLTWSSWIEPSGSKSLPCLYSLWTSTSKILVSCSDIQRKWL